MLRLDEKFVLYDGACRNDSYYKLKEFPFVSYSYQSARVVCLISAFFTHFMNSYTKPTF